MAVVGVGRVQIHYRDGLSRDKYLCHRDSVLKREEGSSSKNERSNVCIIGAVQGRRLGEAKR